MSQSKLTKSEREQIIFDFLKNKPNPLYEVSQTKYGKYIVKPKLIEVEEEEQQEAEQQEEEPKPVKKPVYDKAEAKRERRRRNRHAKQDAKRILSALTNLINSNNGSDESDDGQPIEQQAPRLIEQPNYGPTKLSFHRRRLAF